MKYAIAIFVVSVFAATCFGMTSGSGTSTNVVVGSTNLLKAVKAATNQPPHWDGTITLGITATQGNVNSVLSTAKLLAEKKCRWNQYNLEADGAYGEVSSVKNAESLHGAAQVNHIFIDDKWYGYGHGDGLHDAIQDVEYRFDSGVGGGYYFIKNKMTTLSSEAGPAFESEKLDDEYHDYPTARVAENFEHKIDDHARIWQNVEIIPPLTDPQAFLVNAEVGLETPLTHMLSLQTYVQDNFSNVPAPGFKDNDLKLVSGLVLKF